MDFDGNPLGFLDVFTEFSLVGAGGNDVLAVVSHEFSAAAGWAAT